MFSSPPSFSKQLSLRTLSKLAAITIAGACLGGVIGALMAQYKSEAVLSLQMTVPEYKRFSEAASSKVNLTPLFNSQTIQLSNADQLQLNDIISKRATPWLLPLPKLNKAEAKDLPDSLQKIALESESISNNVNNNNDITGKQSRLDASNKPLGLVYVGARLSAKAPDAQQAARLVSALGIYFKETATKEAMREQLFNWISESQQFNDKSKSQQLKYAFEIEQAQNRANSLKRLLEQYPEYIKGDAKQIIDINQNNQKFIALSTQMLGAEAEIIDIRERLAKINRDQVQNELSLSFLKQAEPLFKQANTGTAAVTAVQRLIQTQLSTVNSDAEKERLLNYAADVSNISARFLSEAQFVVAPSIAEQAEQPRPMLLAAMLGMLSLCAALAYIFRHSLLNLLREDT
jgi:hydroxyethylthiazole kinase-like sugar kinase family protein